MKGDKTFRNVTESFADTIGDGISSILDVVHHLGTEDVVVSVRRLNEPKDGVGFDYQVTGPNTVRLIFAGIPDARSLRVVVM